MRLAALRRLVAGFVRRVRGSMCMRVPEDNGMRKALGPDDTDRAVEELHVGHVALSSSSTVADLRVLSIDANGIKAGREFEPGEAWSDHQRQSEALLGPTSSTK